MLLNLYFLLCCIPIVTIGPACTALYTVTLQEAEDISGSFTQRFFQAFRSNLSKALPLGLVLLLMGAVLGYNYLFLTANPTLDAPVFRGLLVALSLIYSMVVAFAFPLQAKFENTLLQTLRNALALAISNLPKTILMVVLNLLPLLVLLLSEALFLRLSIFLVLIYFAVAAQLNSLMLAGIFRPFTRE